MAVVGDPSGPPGQDVFRWAALLVASVDDIGGVPVPQATTIVHIPIEHEQLVEGHTVFTTMNIIRGPPPPPHNISAAGLIECSFQIDNLTVENLHVDHFFAECHTGGHIFTGSAAMPRPRGPGDLIPTGWMHTDNAPDTGAPVTTIEYAYKTHVRVADGSIKEVTAYCWAAKILDQGINPVTGHAYNFVVSIDVPRLVEMGQELGTDPTDHLSVYAQSQMPANDGIIDSG